MLIQWHLSDSCNLRCTHCYQSATAGDHLDMADWSSILQGIGDLCRYRSESRADITLTGGEPLVIDGFWELAQQISRLGHRLAVLSNGTVIDRSMAQKLKTLAPLFVQVSLDGDQQTHDAIRGKGSFERACAGLAHLVAAKVKTMVAFTAHRNNIHTFSSVFSTAVDIGVDVVWVDRLIPSGKAMLDDCLDPQETRSFFQCLEQEQARRRWPWKKTRLRLHRALQFLLAGGKPYRCNAGNALLAIMPNAEVYPCRRMPISVGNCLQIPLVEIWNTHPLLQSLRSKESFPTGCSGCIWNTTCAGGLRCLAYAMTGDPHSADPGCWRVKGPHRSPNVNLKITNPKQSAAATPA